jgi:hypothetical protein
MTTRLSGVGVVHKVHEVHNLPMTNATNTTKTYEIKTGINGSGQRVWIVLSEWTGEDGRPRGHMERFDNREEAENWIRWS